MKYIRGQDGCIYSVSRLMPPCEEHPEGEAVWKLRVVTVTGSIHVYATYSTEGIAVKVYSYVSDFIGSIQKLLAFKLGVDGKPTRMVEAEERKNDADVIAAQKALEKRAEEIMEDHAGKSPTPLPEMLVPGSARPWMSIPASALTPWWTDWWNGLKGICRWLFRRGESK